MSRPLRNQRHHGDGHRHPRGTGGLTQRPAPVREFTDPPVPGQGQAAFYRQIEQNDQRFTDEVAGRYGEIAVPVLICWGTEDTWIPVAKGHELAARIPGARLRLIEGAGHLAQEDAPGELAVALREFVG
ncbi:alpha/beta fold hydrolase [Streptomyces sp. RGM 3693]|uniref:alpha/beta fold hydrolase n=1 Tax=Streptomyces sp. RGM 3693 TaxID=3413284 RepID=UPI003D2A16DA